MKDELFDHLKHKLSETEIPGPDQGWLHMRALLEANAPARPVSFPRVWYAAAACLALAAGAWALIHYSAAFKSGGQAVVAPAIHGAALQAPATTAAAGASATTGTSATSATAGATTSAGVTTSAGPVRNHATANPAVTDGLPTTAGTTPTTAATGPTEVTSDAGIALSTAKGGFNLLDKPQSPPLATEYKTIRPAVGPVHPAHHSRWNFEFGLGANFPGSFRFVTINGKKKWEAGVYPEVNVLYRLNSRLNLTAGLAAPSPVSYSKTLTNTSLETATNPGQTYTQSTRIGRLLYADLPLGLSWMAIKHVSLDGGIQFSRLLSKQYDTRSSKVNTQGFTPYVLGNAGTPPVVEYSDGQVLKTDARYQLGAAFHWRRLSAGVQYQSGLLRTYNISDGQGNSIENHTSIARMRIMYSLR